MSKKIFCVLEQGKEPYEMTERHKRMFTTEFSDFYRINWFKDDDPYAFIHRKNIVGSEGVSLLYENVPKDYDYYIFTDDDMEFYCHDGSGEDQVALQIKNLLLTYKPIAGTLVDDQYVSNLQQLGIDTAALKEVFVTQTYDQGLQIFSKELLDATFPVIYHGSGGAMHYIHYAVNKLYPAKQHAYTGVRYRNTRHDREWVRPDLPQFKDKVTLYMLFNRHTRDNDFHYYWTDKFWQKTLSYYYNELQPSDEPIKFRLEDFAEIYDCTNSSYVNRKSVVEV
jgi:hypothetical protein